ncbi:MAG: hypothetical protein RR540_07165 [Oscillospiraceae bacterium]
MDANFPKKFNKHLSEDERVLFAKTFKEMPHFSFCLAALLNAVKAAILAVLTFFAGRELFPMLFYSIIFGENIGERILKILAVIIILVLGGFLLINAIKSLIDAFCDNAEVIFSRGEYFFVTNFRAIKFDEKSGKITQEMYINSLTKSSKNFGDLVLKNIEGTEFSFINMAENDKLFSVLNGIISIERN